MLIAAMEQRKEQPRRLPLDPDVRRRIERQMHIGGRVRSLMTRMGMTQASLALAIHMPPSSLSAIFNGADDRILEPADVQGLAMELGVQVSDLEGTGELPEPRKVDERAKGVSPSAGKPDQERGMRENIERGIETFKAINKTFQMTPSIEVRLRAHLALLDVSPTMSVVARYAQAAMQEEIEKLNQ